MPLRAALYWLAVTSGGLACIVRAGQSWNIPSEHLVPFLFYLVAAVGASGMKVNLPGVPGTLSMSYLFIIVALFELQLESAILIGVASVLAQVLIRPRANITWEQVSFSALSISLPITAANQVLHFDWLGRLDPTHCVALLSASMVYFMINTTTVAVIVGWTTRQSPMAVWRDNFIWTSPQYLVGGVLAGALHMISSMVPWQGLLLSGPPLYLVYRSYSLYLGRIEQQQKHIGEMVQLHWRTIEALALAIEAKDDLTAAHLNRVQVYAVEMAKELHLSDAEIKAMEAASLLHDIGKLAVPEYIVSKPGKLTPEEFQKMKIHPVVGAEILERVSFPYPVAPIVRSHHERWDGNGYPDGLMGEEIPIGARILSVVDCLDALASDRQYRRAVPLDQAMEMVAAESGKAFDPRVVALLTNRYKALEAKVRVEPHVNVSSVAKIQVGRGAAPALAATNAAPSINQDAPFTSAIANARREVQMLVEITNDLGNSLSLDETLALLAVRLGRMIPHDAAVIYVKQDDVLVPQYLKGESFSLFSSLRIPIGAGLSGWVVENDLWILNGNPAVETGYLNDPQKTTPLRSAVSIPLAGRNGVIGALTFYHRKSDAFSQDHLRVLLAVGSKAGLAIENSLRFQMARAKAEQDEVTGLMNAGALLVNLEQRMQDFDPVRTPQIALVVLAVDIFEQRAYSYRQHNQILHAVAGALLENCRSEDLVARMGGDEFAILRQDPSADLPYLLAKLGEISREVQAGAELAAIISINFGVSTYPGDGEDAASLIETAGERLREHKRKLESEQRELKFLRNLTNSLRSAQDLAVICATVAAQVRVIIPYDAIAVFLSNGNNLKPQFVDGESSRFLSALEIPLSERKSPVLNGKPSAELRFATETGVATSLESFISVPLNGNVDVVGTLCLYRGEADAFSKNEQDILEAAATKLGVAVENSLRFGGLETSETLDYVTGLPNIQTLMGQLRDDLLRCSRTGDELYVARVTVRGLDQVEKLFGWDCARKSFTQLASELKYICHGDHEYAARHGVEDFALVLSRSTPDTLEDRMTHLAEMIRRISFDVVKAHLFTVSIGVAEFPRDGGSGGELLLKAYERRTTRFRVFSSPAAVAGQGSRALRVFLCHSKGDKSEVSKLYDRLEVDGVDAWMDQKQLLPGQNWELEIERAVRSADVVLVCLSRLSFDKEGYVQKEIKQALDAAQYKMEDSIFLIPVKLDDCEVPGRLKGWQWVDLWTDNGYELLLKSLSARSAAISAVAHRVAAP